MLVLALSLLGLGLPLGRLADRSTDLNSPIFSERSPDGARREEKCTTGVDCILGESVLGE
jgi:hypothetical protein